MTIAYDVQINREQLANALELFEFIGGNADDALRVAINKTAPKVRTRSSERIRSQVRLSASYVNGRLEVTKATRKSLAAAIRTPSRGLLLSRFSTDPLVAGEKVGWIRPPEVPARGIRVKVKPDASPRPVMGDRETAGNKPFYMVLNGGQNVGIVARLAGQRRKVKVFHGPSLSQVFDKVRADVLPEAQRELQVQMVDAIRYLTLKLQPSEGAGA